jgi:hypothetical protein
MTDDLDEIAAALAGFQAEVPVIPKTARAQIQTSGGGGYGYSYADLASIMPIVGPLLSKHGLAFSCMPTRAEDGVPMLLGVLLHSSGQRLQGELPISGRTPQEIGSSLTYGRRYLLCCLTGIVTDDDDDGRLAEQAARVRGGLSAVAETARSSGPRAPEPRADPVVREVHETAAPDRAHQGEPLNTSSALAKRMYAGIRDAGIDKDNVHRFLSEAVGRDITSSKDLTVGEAHRVLDFLPQRPPVAPVEQS